MYKFIFPFSIAVLLVLFAPSLVMASPRLVLHAQYDHSNPPANARLPSGFPPPLVQVWFSEQVDPNFSKLTVFDQQRHEVDLGNSHSDPNDAYSLIVTLRPNLPDGAYTVVYHTVSAEDGHQVTNAFSFVVGGGALPTDTSALLNTVQAGDNNLNIWSVAIRWLNYLGLAGLVGGLAFLLLVWRPSVKDQILIHENKPVDERTDAMESGPYLVMNQGNGDNFAEANARMERGILWFSFVCLLILLVGWISFLVYQASVASASAPWQILSNGAIGTILLHGRFGVIWLVRLALLILACILWWLLYHGYRQAYPISGDEAGPSLSRHSRLLWVILLAGIGMMVTNSLNSHAAANRAAWLLVPVDLSHLLGTGFWVGGLFALVLLLPRALSGFVPGTGDRTRVLTALIPRFTRIALISVGMIALTGLIQALAQLNILPALANGNYGQIVAAFFGNSYGQALVIKSILSALPIGLGAFNAFKISPRMRQFAERESKEDGAGSLAAGRLQRTFRRSVMTEGLIALGLLLVVGGLTSLSPPAPPSVPSSNGPFLRQGSLAGLTYGLAINPGKVGPNSFEIALTDKNGQPVQKTDAVLAYFTMEDMDMSTEVLDFAPIPNKPGHYGATANVLAMSGHWRIDLIIRRPGFADARTSLQATIG